MVHRSKWNEITEDFEQIDTRKLNTISLIPDCIDMIQNFDENHNLHIIKF